MTRSPPPPLRPAEPVDRAAMRLLFQRLDDPETGIHRAISVITFGAAYRHFLIDEAGGTDPALLRPVIDRQMNPKSRAWLEDMVLFGVESRAFPAGPLPAWTLCSTISNAAWERPTG